LKRKIEPNTINKFGIGFISGLGFLFYSLRYFAGADGKSSLNLFTFTWLVITFGELCFSNRMSIMTKLSPKKMFGNDDGNVVFSQCIRAVLQEKSEQVLLLPIGKYQYE
jgi:dipeptide/tripeptide permease